MRRSLSIPSAEPSCLVRVGSLLRNSLSKSWNPSLTSYIPCIHDDSFPLKLLELKFFQPKFWGLSCIVIQEGIYNQRKTRKKAKTPLTVLTDRWHGPVCYGYGIAMKKTTRLSTKNLVDRPTSTLQTKQLIPRIGPLLLIHDSWGRRSTQTNLVFWDTQLDERKPVLVLEAHVDYRLSLNSFMHQKHQKFPVNRVNLHLKEQHDIQNSHDCTAPCEPWKVLRMKCQLKKTGTACLPNIHSSNWYSSWKRNNAKSVNVCQWSVRIILKVDFMKGRKGNIIPAQPQWWKLMKMIMHLFENLIWIDWSTLP